MRVSLLRRVLPARAAAISVTLGSMTQFVGQALFILSGLPVALSLIRGRELRLGLLLLCALLLGFLCLVLFVGFSRSLQDRIGRLVARTRWLAARWTSVPERWQALLGETLTALRERPRAFVSSVTASLLAWQAGVIETFVILRLLQLPVGWPQALAIEVLGVTIEGILFFVPAKMGTQEGGEGPDLPRDGSASGQGIRARAHPPPARARLGGGGPGSPGPLSAALSPGYAGSRSPGRAGRVGAEELPRQLAAQREQPHALEQRVQARAGGVLVGVGQSHLALVEIGELAAALADQLLRGAEGLLLDAPRAAGEALLRHRARDGRLGRRTAISISDSRACLLRLAHARAAPAPCAAVLEAAAGPEREARWRRRWQPSRA